MKQKHVQRATLYLAALLGAVVLLAACGTATPQPLRFGEAPWQSGETATYNVVDAQGNPVGTGVIAITSETVNGSPGWVIRRQVSGLGGGETSSVSFSAGDFRPAQSALASSDASGTERVSATYDKGEVNLELTTKQNNLSYQKYNIPSDARDQRSLWALVRTLPLAQGYSTQLNSFLPLTGQLERVTVSVGKPETVTTPEGQSEALKVALNNGVRESRLWVSVDAPHTIVKAEEGGMTWELMQLKNGAP